MNRLTQDEKTQIVGRYNLGETVIDLARLEGVSENSIYNWINESKKKEVENTPEVKFALEYKSMEDKIRRIDGAGTSPISIHKGSTPTLGSGCFPVNNTISIDDSLAGRNSKFFVICKGILKKRKYTKWEKKVISTVWS